MSRRAKYPDPFFMLFPWLRVAGVLCLLAFVEIFVFRLSETGGLQSRQACIAAMILTAIMGTAGIYPVCKIWRRGILLAITAIISGSVIRLLIGGAGVAIIAFFTQLNKSWFIFYVFVYYILFLMIDTAFALWMLCYCRRSDDKERRVHDNLWDMVS